jgi:NADPH:quinone reductase
MQALVCHAFAAIDELKVETLPTPQPGPKQVLIDVKAASINYPDTLIVQGLYQVKPPLPFVPGAELAGVVAALGSEVRHLRVGERVVASTGTGAFAQQCVADASRTGPLPAAMGFEEGASLVLVYGTSLHALQTVARLQPGETLLVLGAAGGVGIAAVQIAKALGARVIAAASSAAKLALAREAGADHLVDYSDAQWRKAVEAIVGDKGVDVVYDPVGGAYSETALRLTGWRGRYLVVGFAAGDIPKLPLNLMLLKERVVQGVFWGAAMQREPAQHLANMKLLAEWFASGRIRPPVTERVPLEGAAAAMQRLAARQAMGKVVVLP